MIGATIDLTRLNRLLQKNLAPQGSFVLLLDSQLRLLSGSDDALVPAVAYTRFAELAALRTAPYCTRRIDGADHGLQRATAGMDGVQQVWAWTEQWARQPAAGLCAPLRLLREKQAPSAAGTS